MRFEPLRRTAAGSSAPFLPRPANALSEAALSEAYERGRKEAAEACDHRWREALDALFAAAAELRGEAARIERLATERAASVIARIVVEAAPAIALASAKQAIEALIQKGPNQDQAGFIVVKANAELLAALAARLDDQGGASGVRFEADATLGPGRIVANWRDGSVDCNPRKAALAIVDFIEKSEAHLKGPIDDDESDI